MDTYFIKIRKNESTALLQQPPWLFSAVLTVVYFKIRKEERFSSCTFVRCQVGMEDMRHS